MSKLGMPVELEIDLFLSPLVLLRFQRHLWGLLSIICLDPFPSKKNRIVTIELKLYWTFLDQGNELLVHACRTICSMLTVYNNLLDFFFQRNNLLDENQ